MKRRSTAQASILARGRGGACLLVCSMLLVLAQALDANRLLRVAQGLGPDALHRTQELVNQMTDEARSSELDKLKSMNTYFNRTILYEDDQVAWGKVDYWSSPIELLNRGVGDCEDYALAKYFSLISMGVSPAKLRMVYVRAELGGTVQAHMVLAYYPEPTAEPLILDNLISEVRPASRRPDLSPVFSFNAQGLWQGVGQFSAGDPVARLSKWRDVLSRAKSEGWW